MIVDLMDKSFVLVTGPKKITGVRRRRTNTNHVEPLQDKLEIKRGATDEDVEAALKGAGKLDFMSQMIRPVLD